MQVWPFSNVGGSIFVNGGSICVRACMEMNKDITFMCVCICPSEWQWKVWDCFVAGEGFDRRLVRLSDLRLSAVQYIKKFCIYSTMKGGGDIYD